MVNAGKLEIFRHEIESIVEEMGVTLQRTAYSTNIKIRRDHTCALFDHDLRHIAQHDIAPQHIGSLVQVVPRIVGEWKDDLTPGDGILVNDPYKGTVHLPDVMLISPLFHGGDVVGYAANSAHHVDIGGGTPGGVPTDSTELYAEGLIIPGIKAVQEWKFRRPIIDLITRNVRVSKMRKGDYQAQLGANRIGQERYSELFETSDKSAIAEKIDALLDYTERRVRKAIEQFPDGTYEAEDYMDGDGLVDEPVRLKLALVVDGDEMTVDFTGTDSENEGPLNSTPSAVFAGTMSVIMSVVGGELPKNDGFYRPLEFVTPEGTMVNPSINKPVAGCWEVAMRAGELVTKAMADAIPKETIASTKGIVCNVAFGGVDPRDGEDYVFLETVAGGYGGRATKDGMDAVQTHFQNTANSPIEELETEIPLYLRRYELIRDSEGAGRCRGGLGVRRDYEFYDHRASFSILSDRTKSKPWGLFGGHSARAAQFTRNPTGDKPESLGSKSTTKLNSNEVVSVQTPGGGGYGDPLNRDPEAVLWDVINEKVSERKAEKEYGVVIDANKRAINWEATDERREKLKADVENGDGRQ